MAERQQSDTVGFMLRMKEHQHARLKAAAEARGWSLNAEINRRLADSLDATRPDAGMVIAELQPALQALRRVRDSLAKDRPKEALELAAISERLFGLSVRVFGIAFHIVDGKSDQ